MLILFVFFKLNSQEQKICNDIFMHARFSYLLSMVYFLITLGLYIYSYKIEQLKIENLIWPRRHQHYKKSVCLGGSVEIDNSRKTLLTSALRRLTIIFSWCQFQLLPSQTVSIYIMYIQTVHFIGCFKF